jgi:hypothetical protein
MTESLPLAGVVIPRLPCDHTPVCPPHDDADHDAARPISSHPEQGWTLLCNGVVVFEDTGELLPNGTPVAPHRPEPAHAGSAGAR